MTKPRLRLVTPTTENRTVALRRPKNGALRTREHLTIDEVERLIEAAKNNRYGHRDALMALLAFRHGLRAGEVVDLRWDQIDFKAATLHVQRLKSGTPSTHPLTGRECGRCGVISAKARNRRSCSSPNVAHPFQALVFPGWSNGQLLQQSWQSRSMPTCCATPVATSSRMTGRTPVHCKPILGIEIFRILHGTLRWRRIGSKVSGATRSVTSLLCFLGEAARTWGTHTNKEYAE